MAEYALEWAGCDHRWINVTTEIQRCCECAIERYNPDDEQIKD